MDSKMNVSVSVFLEPATKVSGKKSETPGRWARNLSIDGSGCDAVIYFDNDEQIREAIASLEGLL